MSGWGSPCGCARADRSAACGMPFSGLPSSTVPSASLCPWPSALIPRVPSKEHSALAEAFGFKQAEELAVLGVRGPFDGAWTLLRLRVRKVVLRVRLHCQSQDPKATASVSGGAPFLLGCWLC